MIFGPVRIVFYTLRMIIIYVDYYYLAAAAAG